MNMKCRLAKNEDLVQIMEVIEDGRKFLKEAGNGQWQFGYPNEDDFKNDIKNGFGFVLENDDQIVAYFAATYYEEPYHNLYEGKWLTDLPYMVMHRCAVRESVRRQNVGKAMLEAFEEIARSRNYRSLRIDTHKNNAPLCNLLIKCEWTYCGRVWLPPGKDRVVYEKVLNDE